MSTVRRTLVTLVAALAVLTGGLGAAAPASALTTTTITSSYPGYSFYPVGTPFTVSGTVTTDGTSRPVQIQAKLSGAASWSVLASQNTSTSGSFSQSTAVVAGYSEYRVVATATATMAAATAYVGALWSLTAVSFDTTPVASTVGDSVERTITVSPAGARTVQLIAKQEGMGTTTVAQLQTDAAGQATVYVPVLPGTVSWHVEVLADYSLGGGVSSGILSVTGPLQASGASGWSTTSAVMTAGTTVTSSIETTVSYAPRDVSVEYAAYGTSTWTTISSTTIDSTGTVAFVVRPGKNLYRLVVAPTATHMGSVSGTRLITAKSRVLGFSTTTTTKAAGTVVKDGITVTPGRYRTVKIQYRKGTSGTWLTYATRTASSTGTLTVSMKAFRGVYSWRVYVPASTAHGTSAWTSPRVLKGL